MWVPCALLVRACRLAVSAACHVRQASGRCSHAASCMPTRGTASHTPASCLLVELSCLQRPLQLPVTLTLMADT
jgi:hypothetical protein